MNGDNEWLDARDSYMFRGYTFDNMSEAELKILSQDQYWAFDICYWRERKALAAEAAAERVRLRNEGDLARRLAEAQTKLKAAREAAEQRPSERLDRGLERGYDMTPSQREAFRRLGTTLKG